MIAAPDSTRLLGFVWITSEPRSTGREEEGSSAVHVPSTDSQAFTRDTVS